MRELIDTLLADVTIAGYHVAVYGLVAAALILFGLISRRQWFTILGIFLFFFFYLFVPAVDKF